MSFKSSNKPYYLLDKNSLRQMMMNNKRNVKILTSSEMFQNNFEDVNCAETDDQEIERVKSLDIWNIPKTSRPRGPNISLTGSHSAKQFHSKKIKDGLDFPHIKTELVNRILADPQDDNDVNGPSTRFKTNDNEDATKLPLLNYENNPLKKKEISKHGYNEELIHDIIMKKIKEQIKLEDAAKLTLTQLKLHVKAIAEDAVAHFKSLKGILTAQHIQNYVTQTLDMLRESNKKDTLESKPPSADIKNWPQEEKPLINHELSGMALMRELNMHSKESKDLRQLGISIDQAIFKSKKQKAIWEEKLKQIKREIKDLVEEIELASQHTHSNKNYSRRRSAVSDPQRIEDFIQLKKTRDEKKAEEEQILRKLNDIDVQLDRLATESKRTELARREVKAKKLYSKVQLKNLYYAMLKDEAALMQNSNSGKGCIWALKALWNMGEDVKESAFPAFLDHKAVEFTLKYAKAQFNLETFCAQNHLTEALSPHKTPRLKTTFLSPLTARDKLLIPQSADTNASDAAGTILELDSEVPSTRQFTKSLNCLRSEYQEKTNALKRTNLKAKRQIFFGNPLSKDKSVSSRWEEVDPKEAENEVYYGSFDSPSEIDTIKKHRSEIKPPSLIKPIVSNSPPFEKAVEMTNKLDELKKEGVEKLTEHYMHKLVDERTKLEVHKIFRFIFGKEEGEFLFHKLVMEKKYNDEKMLIKVKKAQPKKISPDATPALKLNKSSSETHRHASASLGRSANTPSTKSKFLIPL